KLRSSSAVCLLFFALLSLASFCPLSSSRFFSPVTPPTEISTLSLHDALPIFELPAALANATGIIAVAPPSGPLGGATAMMPVALDRKSTRLNSSHRTISYAVFCLKKKKKLITSTYHNDHSPYSTKRSSASHTF